jgi:hypothetical protein
LPNTLAHLGIQTLASRTVIPAPDPKWIYLGCVIPDLPWIARRVVAAFAPGIDLIDLRLYAIVQSTLIVSLLLCGALALVSQSPRKIFAILSLNTLLHLLFDALQTKWGNGVHLFAPVSWETWNLGLFWPESAVTLVATVLGLGIIGWTFWRGVERPVGLCGDRPIQILGATVLLSAYVALPLALLRGAEASDTHFVRTIRNGPARAGHEIAVDRADFTRDEKGDRLRLYSGEEVAVIGRLPAQSALVSVRGRFSEPSTLVIEELHVHAGRLRDRGSYIGLALVALAWLLPVRQPRTGDRDST